MTTTLESEIQYIYTAIEATKDVLDGLKKEIDVKDATKTAYIASIIDTIVTYIHTRASQDALNKLLKITRDINPEGNQIH